MASWLDFLSLAVTITVVAGSIYGIIYVIQVLENGWKSTKESLKTKGLDVSPTGISVRTSRRFDRQDYMDATHRGLVRVVGASSFRKGESTAADSSQSSPKMERVSSNSGNSISNEKKEKRIHRSNK